MLKDLTILGVPEEIHARLLSLARNYSYKFFEKDLEHTQATEDAVQAKKDKFDTDNPRPVDNGI